MPIDYVIPFVDCSDRSWLLEYKKYVSGTSDWSNNSTRFRDWDTLRYQLRSIERYLPWIRNIYIVMSISETQIPKWLNTQHERVHIVWDWEIVPHEYLPVFNSNVIDLYIPRIEGLSEHYLYACDDYIVMRELKPEDFFSENGVRLKVGRYKFRDWTYTRTILNSCQLICPQYITKADGCYLLPYSDHAIVPHLRMENQKVMKKYQCHISDAGYDVSDFDKILKEFDRVIGLDRLLVVHVNDSKNPIGAHKDRHENIGYGYIGFEALYKVVNHPLLKDVPKILETPYYNEKAPYKQEIEMLRSGKFVNWRD